jgi:hypothetical protein
MKKAVYILSICSLFFSCKKQDVTKPEPLPEFAGSLGTVDIDITNMVGNLPLSLTTGTYTNANTDTFSVDLFKYYISNVQLVTSSAIAYSPTESYYLIDQASNNSKHLVIKNVPYDNYTSMSFLIGVDAARNTSGAQTGALDVSNDMFWTWSSGYIMAKIEGHSPQSPNSNKAITYHIGGFQGLNNGVRKVTLTFPNAANVTKNQIPTINIKADLAQWFTNPNNISIATTNIVTSVSVTSKAIADNYKNMFTITSVVN